MPDSKANDAVAKQRIIAHMNKDHQDSLVRYLEYFGHLSSFTARNARLTEITLDHLVISTNGSSHTIPIRPPMASLSDARPRVVAMDAEAVAGLKRSDFTVKRYKGPTASQAIIWVLSVFLFALSSMKSNFLPGSLAYDYMWRYAPGIGEWCLKLRVLALVVFLVHLAEALYMAFFRSRKHSIPMCSTLWWKWTLSVLIGGFGEIIRFGEVVKEVEIQRMSAKH